MAVIDPKLDLKLERTVDLGAEAIWKAWTTPAILKEWFCPHPWKTVKCEMELHPGGVFSTVMESPTGDTAPESVGCILEVVENRKLVWTSALLPGFRPAKAAAPFAFTATLLLEP